MTVCILCTSDKGRQIVDEKFYVCFDCIDRVAAKKREYVKPTPTEGLPDFRELMNLTWGVYPGQEEEIVRYTRV
jgi:hypothetical protein